MEQEKNSGDNGKGILIGSVMISIAMLASAMTYAVFIAPRIPVEAQTVQSQQAQQTAPAQTVNFPAPSCGVQ